MRRDEPFDPPCPDGAIRHGPLDVYGRCPWCGNKVDRAWPAPRRYPRSELSEAYERHYDPDWGALGKVELERRRLAGVGNY